MAAGWRFRISAASASFVDAWYSPSAAMIFALRSRSASAWAAMARCISCGRSTCFTCTCVILHRYVIASNDILRWHIPGDDAKGNFHDLVDRPENENYTRTFGFLQHVP